MQTLLAARARHRRFHPALLHFFREGYSFRLFLRDLLAGLIVGVVALPLAIAFGIASGVTPTQGLVTAVVTGFLVSLLSGSRVQIGGPTGAFIVIIYGIVQQHGVDGLAAATLMAGALLVVMGACGIGGIIKYIPYPVTVGFTAGIALILSGVRSQPLLVMQRAGFLEKVGEANVFGHIDEALDRARVLLDKEAAACVS